MDIEAHADRYYEETERLLGLLPGFTEREYETAELVERFARVRTHVMQTLEHAHPAKEGDRLSRLPLVVR